jgi:hypothetical protein
MFHGKGGGTRRLVIPGKGGHRGLVFLTKGGRRGFVFHGKGGRRRLVFHGKEGCGGLVIHGKGRCLGIVFLTKGSCQGLVLCRTLYKSMSPTVLGISGKKQELSVQKCTCISGCCWFESLLEKRILNSIGSFKQETVFFEVNESSLDVSDWDP